jgi:hypothetical protein
MMADLEYSDLSRPGVLGSIKNYALAYTLKPSEAIKKLQSSTAYTIHKARFKRFPRRAFVGLYMYEILHMDLADTSNFYPKDNKDTKFLLVVIDTLSRMLFVEPLKSKNMPTVNAAMRAILDRIKKPIKSIYSDSGAEFFNRLVAKLLKSRNIKQYSSLSDQKACKAERAIRQLKSRIAKFMTARKTTVYINDLQSIVANINDTPNRVIGMAPSEVNEYNEMLVFRKSTVGLLKKPKNTYRVGDHVRVSLLRGPFSKEHRGNFSEEIFKIVKVDNRVSPEVYSLIDYNKNPIKGIFYRQELVAAQPPEKYKIRVLEKKGQKYRVHWVGYPAEFDSWVHKNDVSSLSQ